MILTIKIMELILQFQKELGKCDIHNQKWEEQLIKNKWYSDRQQSGLQAMH